MNDFGSYYGRTYRRDLAVADITVTFPLCPYFGPEPYRRGPRLQSSRIGYTYTLTGTLFANNNHNDAAKIAYADVCSARIFVPRNRRVRWISNKTKKIERTSASLRKLPPGGVLTYVRII